MNNLTTDEEGMLIGELARRANVSVRTIRFYIAEGLLPAPQTRGRFTSYDEDALLRLQAIRYFKEAFLPLREIRDRLDERRARDHRMNLGMILGPQVIGRHHPLERCDERAIGIGKEGRYACERLLLFRVEHVQDRPDQKRMAGLFPMVALVERALGIDQDVGDVLDVADFPFSPANLEQGVVGCRLRIGRIEQQHATMP